MVFVMETKKPVSVATIRDNKQAPTFEGYQYVLLKENMRTKSLKKKYYKKLVFPHFTFNGNC